MLEDGNNGCGEMWGVTVWRKMWLVHSGVLFRLEDQLGSSIIISMCRRFKFICPRCEGRDLHLNRLNSIKIGFWGCWICV